MTARDSAARAAATVLLGAALAGCGSLTPDGRPPADNVDSKPTASSTGSSEPSEAAPLPPGTGKPPRPALPTHVNTADPDAVGRAALTAMWTMDTTTDASQYDATNRAAPYLTKAYAAQLKAAPPRSAPGAEWETWTQHRAYTTVALTAAADAGRPSDTPTTAYRTWTITTTPHGDHGWTDSPTTTTAFVLLTHEGKTWAVSTVNVQ